MHWLRIGKSHVLDQTTCDGIQDSERFCPYKGDNATQVLERLGFTDEHGDINQRSTSPWVLM